MLHSKTKSKDLMTHKVVIRLYIKGSRSNLKVTDTLINDNKSEKQQTALMI